MASELITTRPPVDRAAIPYAHWSARVGRDAPALGEIVSEYDDLAQGIATLFLTPKGSVPTEPLKGCDVLRYMDRPPSEAVVNMLPEMWEALADWHPRIVCEELDLVPLAGASEAGFSAFRATVRWRPRDSVAQSFLTTVAFDEGGATDVQTSPA